MLMIGEAVRPSVLPTCKGRYQQPTLETRGGSVIIRHTQEKCFNGRVTYMMIGGSLVCFI